MEKLILDMKKSTLEEVHKLMNTFKRWKNEILKYFENGALLGLWWNAMRH
jgi:transposase